jgi:hypothetical protein
MLSVGRMLRQIHDSLARSTTNDPVVIRIDSASLQITDPTQARTILLASGAAIVASGYPKQVLQLLDLVDSRTKSLPRLQLAAGYAEYMLGKHYNAVGHIRQAMARAQELSKRDKAFLSRLKDACEFKAGIIDTETYQQRTDERARALTGLESLEAQLETLNHQCLSERNPEVRATLKEAVRGITHQILNHPEATEPIKLGSRLTLLYVEGTETTMWATHRLGLARMRRSMRVAHTRGSVKDYQQVMNRLDGWEVSSNAVLRSAFDLGHPILIVEAYAVVLGVFMIQLLNRRLEALWLGKIFKVSQAVSSQVTQAIESALAIDEVNGAIESRLRVNILKMDFLELTGDLASAKELAGRIYPEAHALGFANIEERAKALMDDRTLLMQSERDLARFKQTDEDVSIAGQSDEEVQCFARDIQLSLCLPPSRLKVIEQCCQSLRDVARERCRWCRYLNILEEQPPIDPVRAYSTLPNQKCVCEKFGHETKIVTSDAKALIGAFKQLYCANCQDRAPKQAPSRG